VVLDPGITNFNNRHIAQNNQLLTKYFSRISVFKLALTVPYFILLLIWYFIFSEQNKTELHLVILLGFSQILNSIVLYNRSNLSGLHLFKTDTFISILDKMLMIIFVGVFLYIPSLKGFLDIQLFCILQLLSFGITAVVSFFIVKFYCINPSFKFDKKFCFLIIKESFPFALLALLMVLYAKIDTVLLKMMHPNGNEEVGIYAAAYRLIDAANMIAILFSGLLYPIFSRLIKDKKSVEPMVKTGFKLLVFPAFAFAVVVYVFSMPLMELLYLQHAAFAGKLLGLLLISFVASCITYVCGTLLTANGNIQLLNKIAAIAVIFNVLSNLIFIPEYGAIACAWNAMLSFGFVALAHLYYATKVFSLKIKMLTVIKLFIALLLSYLTSQLLANYHLPALWSITIALLLAILFLSILRLISFKQLNNIIKAEE
jgi:O-antigen/teichoic acid export membrane protein